MTDVVVAQLSSDEARTIVNRIRQSVAVANAEIKRAYDGRAWVSLGYESWEALCAAEFVVDAEIVEPPEPAPVTGRDGKKYPAMRSTPVSTDTPLLDAEKRLQWFTRLREPLAAINRLSKELRG